MIRQMINLQAKEKRKLKAALSIMKDLYVCFFFIYMLYIIYIGSVSDNHILGQKVQRGKTEGMLQLLVFVENRGEESYESMLNITLPPGVSFFRITDRKYVSTVKFYTPPKMAVIILNI